MNVSRTHALTTVLVSTTRGPSHACVHQGLKANYAREVRTALDLYNVLYSVHCKIWESFTLILRDKQLVLPQQERAP